MKALLILIPIVAVLAVAWWWSRPNDSVRELAAHASAFARLERTPARDLGRGVERWRIFARDGREVDALWRPAPAGAADSVWTAVILGGIGTGERAALLLPAETPVHLLAVDWPWDGPLQMPAFEFLRRLPEIHRALLRSPASMALGVDALRDVAGVDTTRIALVGVSLGVPTTIAACRLTPLPSALVLMDGAADIEGLLRAELERMNRVAWLARPLAALGARLARPLEPTHHSQAVARLPVLLVNARHDERLPRHAVEALHRAFPHAERRWRPDLHVRPERLDAIATLASESLAWLETLPRAR